MNIYDFMHKLFSIEKNRSNVFLLEFSLTSFWLFPRSGLQIMNTNRHKCNGLRIRVVQLKSEMMKLPHS